MPLGISLICPSRRKYSSEGQERPCEPGSRKSQSGRGTRSDLVAGCLKRRVHLAPRRAVRPESVNYMTADDGDGHARGMDRHVAPATLGGLLGVEVCVRNLQLCKMMAKTHA